MRAKIYRQNGLANGACLTIILDLLVASVPHSLKGLDDVYSDNVHESLAQLPQKGGSNRLCVLLRH